MSSQQASNNRWRKGFLGLLNLAKMGCSGLLAGLNYPFPSLLFNLSVASQMNTVGLQQWFLTFSLPCLP